MTVTCRAHDKVGVVVKKFGLTIGAIAAVMVAPMPAMANVLTFSGGVILDSTTQTPVPNARVTVTFYGHERGIVEYTTTRTEHVRTDADGRFAIEVKDNQRRYIWNYATVSIGATDVSKGIQTVGVCADTESGFTCAKTIQVPPMLLPLAQQPPTTTPDTSITEPHTAQLRE